jgi:hypothetical protein
LGKVVWVKVKFLQCCLVCLGLLAALSPLAAEPASEWVRRWNAEEGREAPLRLEDLVVKTSQDPMLEGLQVAGFRQSDGTFPLGKLMWKGKALSPLQGLGQVLADLNFSDMSDAERQGNFLTLLQESYGLLGTRVYTGKAMSSRGEPRPEPIRSIRGADDSHRFQVWFYEFPVDLEEGEWREVLYQVSQDGSTVKARTLGVYAPRGERLTGFPSISQESFE